MYNCPGKKTREEEQAKREANDREITEFFAKGQSTALPRAKAVKTKEDNAFMTKLLGEVDANIPAPISRPAKRPRSPGRRKEIPFPPPQESKQPSAKKAKIFEEFSPPAKLVTQRNTYATDDFAGMDLDDDSDPLPAVASVSISDPSPSSPTVKAAERKSQVKTGIIQDEDEDDDTDEMVEVTRTATVTTMTAEVSTHCPQPKKLLKPEPKLSHKSRVSSDVGASSWNDVVSRLNVVSSWPTETRMVGKLDPADFIEEDGSLNFFWTDYTEVNGSLCLFGKALSKKTDSYASCFVKVDNILRKLFFLPRKLPLGHEEISPDVWQELHEEVENLLTKLGVDEIKAKICKRQYAFELPEIPKKAEYLKVFYSYTSKFHPSGTRQVGL